MPVYAAAVRTLLENDLLLVLEAAGVTADRMNFDSDLGTPSAAILSGHRSENDQQTADIDRIAADLRALTAPPLAAQYHALVLETAEGLEVAAEAMRDGFAGDPDGLSRAGDKLAELAEPVDGLIYRVLFGLALLATWCEDA